MALLVLDGSGDTLGQIESLDELDKAPDWENALGRTVRQIANANDGYIEDEDGSVVWDGAE